MDINNLNNSNNLDLLNQSYCISCDHIKKLNEDYRKYNDTVFNKHFTCLRNKDNEDYNYKSRTYNTNNYNNRNYDLMPSANINKKTCYDPSLNERDNRDWELLFIQINNNLSNINFNVNTRRKTKLT